MSENTYRRESYIEASVKEGLIFGPAWTQEWGLKVYPWYSMDKIKFSFIDKGASGKGKSFDVCVNTKKDYSFDFDTFMHEVLHDVRTPYDFLTVMAKEKNSGEKYPKRYKFITGENAEKSVGICNSTKGEFCINGVSEVDGKKVYANIPCSYYDILNIVTVYKETYEKRRFKLKEMRENGIDNLEKLYREYKPKVELEPITEAKQETVENMRIPNEPLLLKATTISKISKDNNTGHFFFTASLKEDNKDSTLIQIYVKNETVELINKNDNLFNKFINRVNGRNEGTDFRFVGIKDINGNYIFQNFR